MYSYPRASGRSHQGRDTSASRESRRRSQRHHHSAARYSTSRSPLRGYPRHRSIPHSRNTRSPGPSGAAAPKSPFHAGLKDILQGLFGHGERGPTPEEMQKLADDFGDLMVGELLDRLVVELKQGLLEKLLIEYLEEMVTGAVRKKIGGKGKEKDKGDGVKKGLLKQAAKMLVKRFTRHQ